MKRLVLIVLLLPAFSVTQQAKAIEIRVPEHYATIQAAIDGATTGDSIVVAPGIFFENIQYRGKNVILRSTEPTSPALVSATIIDGNQAGPVVTFAGTETSSCVLSGFTIRNGGTTNSGSGISGRGAYARVQRNIITSNRGSGAHRCNGTIENNIITHNTTGLVGGGLAYCGGRIQNNTIARNSTGDGGGLAFCGGTIRSNMITSNTAQHDGGGLSDCDGTIENNMIAGNAAGVGGGLDNCSGLIQNNLVTHNSVRLQGGGLFNCYNATIRNNVIASNSSGGTGGGLDACVGATIMNCIVWGNSASLGPQIYYSATPSYSCVEGYTLGTGLGNIGRNPQFVGADDYRLSPNSPCIDAGTNDNYPAADLDGKPRPIDGNRDGRAVCDMGAYEYGVPLFTATPRCLWALYR